MRNGCLGFGKHKAYKEHVEIPTRYLETIFPGDEVHDAQVSVICD